MIAFTNSCPEMIVDFHCHYSPAFFRYREYSMKADDLVSGMDQHGIEHAVLSAAGEFASYSNAEGNTAVAEIIRR